MILVAVPTFENIAPECFKAIYDLKGSDLSFDYVRGYDCAKARNDIARKALEGGFEYVLMVDSDIVCPPNTLTLMLENPVDVCFGTYPRKKAPEQTEAFKTGTFSFENRYTFNELQKAESNKVNVKGSGFGCALIRTQLFNELPYPWFQYMSYEDETYLSEDLYFCMMADRYSLQVDRRIICGHISRIVR